MPKVLFNEPFHYDERPQRAVCHSFEVTGKPVTVKKEIAEAAVKAGKAVKSEDKTSD